MAIRVDAPLLHSPISHDSYIKTYMNEVIGPGRPQINILKPKPGPFIFRFKLPYRDRSMGLFLWPKPSKYDAGRAGYPAHEHVYQWILVSKIHVTSL